MTDIEVFRMLIVIITHCEKLTENTFEQSHGRVNFFDQRERVHFFPRHS